MDVIVNDNLHAVERVANTDDDQQGHRNCSARPMQPLDQGPLVKLGKHEQRCQQPDAEEQQGDAGNPLGQPMLATMMRGAEAADSAERRGAVAPAHFVAPRK